jgi:hypothetical protein
MIHSDILLNALITVWMFFAIVWIWVFCFRNYRIDEFRQNLFRLRDEMFDFAAEGNIRFDHEAYIQLRQLMNGAIRMAETLTFWYFLFDLLFYNHKEDQSKANSFTQLLFDNLNTIENQEFKKEMCRFHFLFHVEMIRHIVLRSFLLSIFVHTIYFMSKISESTLEHQKKIIERIRNSKIFRSV